MQINTGIRSLLAAPLLYRIAMKLLGGGEFRRWFIDNILSLRDGQKIVDFGSGPADVLSELPATVEYVGLDFSDAYIEAAQRRYGDRGLFIAGDVKKWALDERLQWADIVMSYGVLHHIDDDEAKKVVQFAYEILKPGGRFIFFEPCYLLWQSRFSVFMMSKDRGQNIRTEREWKSLTYGVFPRAQMNVVVHSNRLGYTHIIGQCVKEAG